MSQHPLPQARTTGIVTQDLPDEVLVYDLDTHKAHCLNRTAATVWKYCDGKTSVSEMTVRMNREFNQAIDEPMVWQALDRLGKASLLEERVISPTGNLRFGRREAMRRIGLGSAIAVPVVMSILAPTALAGCTIPDNSVPITGACCTGANCVNGNCCTSGPNIGKCGDDTGRPCDPSTSHYCCSNVCTPGTPPTCAPLPTP